MTCSQPSRLWEVACYGRRTLSTTPLRSTPQPQKSHIGGVVHSISDGQACGNGEWSPGVPKDGQPAKEERERQTAVMHMMNEDTGIKYTV